MDKKVININTLKIHGKDALIKDDNELVRDTLRKFIENDIDDGKALLDMFVKLKEESKTSPKSYDDLVIEELERFNNGIYIEPNNRERFTQILTQNGINKYTLVDDKYRFSNYNLYQKALFIGKNI